MVWIYNEKTFGVTKIKLLFVAPARRKLIAKDDHIGRPLFCLCGLYSYDVTVANNMNFRCDLVYMDCEYVDGEDYWITDAEFYFEQKAMMDADDHKRGRNQWMENYLRIQSRRGVLSDITVNRGENLDYDKQEVMKIFDSEEA